MGATAEVTAPDGATIAYRRFGEGERRLVLVHGWMTSGAVFDALVEALDPSAWTVVVPDLVGTGASSRPETGYALMRFAADVLAVIEHARLERPIVLGHSMGGQIAQLVAAAMTDAIAGLVLVTPVPLGGLRLPEAADDLFRTAAGDVNKLATILNMASPELDARAQRRLIDLALEVSDACLVEGFDAWSAGGFEDRLADITAPTLVVATDDAFLPRELLQQGVVDRIAGARLVHLAGAGHYPVVEKPGELAALLDEFATDR